MAIDPKRVAETIAEDDASAVLLGISISSVSEGTASATMAVRPDMDNGHGVCHGGIIFTLADAAMAYACNSYNQRTMAVGADISFVSPALVGVVLTATATETVRRGRSGVYDVIVTDEDGLTVAVFRGRTRQVGDQIIPDETQ